MSLESRHEFSKIYCNPLTQQPVVNNYYPQQPISQPMQYIPQPQPLCVPTCGTCKPLGENQGDDVGREIAGGFCKYYVRGIYNIPISSTRPTANQVYMYDSAADKWLPKSITNSGVTILPNQGLVVDTTGSLGINCADLKTRCSLLDEVAGDLRYVNISGDTMTGSLSITGNLNTTQNVSVGANFSTSGTNTLTGLSGIGNRMVVATLTGVLTTQAIPTSLTAEDIQDFMAPSLASFTTYNDLSDSFSLKPITLSQLGQSGAIINQFPQWNGTTWTPVTIPTPNFTFAVKSDLGFDFSVSNSNTVTLQGADGVTTTNIADNIVKIDVDSTVLRTNTPLFTVTAGNTVNPQTIVAGDNLKILSGGGISTSTVNNDTVLVTLNAQLTDLVDTTITAPFDGQYLTYDGILNQWTNKTLPSLTYVDSSTVDFTGNTANVPLRINGTGVTLPGGNIPNGYNFTSSGGTVNITNSSAGVINLEASAGTPPVLSDLIAGTRTTLTGSGLGKLIGVGNVTVNNRSGYTSVQTDTLTSGIATVSPTGNDYIIINPSSAYTANRTISLGAGVTGDTITYDAQDMVASDIASFNYVVNGIPLTIGSVKQFIFDGSSWIYR